MSTKELINAYNEVYDYMATSKNPEYMKAFGKTMTEMFEWFANNKPEMAEEWLYKLEAIKWVNYLTPKEAENITASMQPTAPWTRDQWRVAMTDHGYDLEEMPCYNKCAMYATMSMIYSDSLPTLKKYLAGSETDMFEVIHSLALDKLKDADKRFSVRKYFGV